MLEAGYELTLSESEVQRLSRLLVGWLDLLQAGNSGEPLHPSLKAPQQLLEFEHQTGIFRAKSIPFEAERSDGLARPQPPRANEEAARASTSDSFPEADAWRRSRPGAAKESYVRVVERLEGHIEAILQRLKAENGDSASNDEPAVVVTLDLDFTLWAGTCIEWPVGSFKALKRQKGSSWETPLRVFDEKEGVFLELHADVPLIFDALRRAGVPIAIASASPAAASANALLRAFGLMGDEDGGERALAVQMGEDEEIREQHKVVHIQKIAEKLDVRCERFLLFDDEPSNVEKVREVLQCSALLVDPAGGLTAETLLRGLEHRLSEVRLRNQQQVAQSRELNRHATEAESKETRRKMKQSAMDRLAQGQAQVDQGRIDTQLAKLEVQPAWWLVAPLRPRRGGENGASGASGISGHKTIDWSLTSQGVELFGTADWPSLDHLEHPLVGSSVRKDDDELAPGEVELCALATYGTERNRHHNFLQNVTVEHNMSVSGDVASRAVHASADRPRLVQPDGIFRTQDTDRAVDYRPANVRLLPLRSSQHRALKLLKRLLWRLEHLVRISEPDVAAMLQIPLSISKALPSTEPLTEPLTVPLSLLSAALTHKGANAEAVSLASAPTPDQFLHDGRGCCNWETLEWFGDAVLRFFSVAHVLFEKDANLRAVVAHAAFAQLSPAAEAILANQPLYRQGKGWAIEL